MNSSSSCVAIAQAEARTLGAFRVTGEGGEVAGGGGGLSALKHCTGITDSQKSKKKS